MKVKTLDPIIDDYGNEWEPCIPKTKLYCFTTIRTKINGELRAFWVYKTDFAKQFKKEVHPNFLNPVLTRKEVKL